MSTGNEDNLISQVTLTLQIIVGALVAGLVSFLLVVLFIFKPFAHPKPGPNAAPAKSAPIITYMALGFSVVCLPLSVLLPAALMKAQRRSIAKGTWRPPQAQGASTFAPGPMTDRTKLMLSYQTQKIVGAAVNEFPAFLALIAYMLEGQTIAVGLALLLILGVAARMPSRTRVDQWLDDQLALMAQEQQPDF